MPPLAVSAGLSRWVLDSMLPVTAVLTCLRLFRSPAIVKLVVFLGTFPGLVVTPFAGGHALRDGPRGAASGAARHFSASGSAPCAGWPPRALPRG